MDTDFGHPGGLPMNGASEAVSAVPVGIPDASTLAAQPLDKEWSYLVVEDPRDALRSFREAVRREMATCQQSEREARKKAAYETEIADDMAKAAAEHWALLNALDRMVITHPSEEAGDERA